MYTDLTLNELVFKLKKVSDWYKLGVLLDVPIWELKKIEQLNGGVEKYKTELFDFWLKNSEAPTWETIVNAVRQLDRNLAKRLAAKVHQQKPHLSTGVAKAEGIYNKTLA